MGTLMQYSDYRGGGERWWLCGYWRGALNWRLVGARRAVEDLYMRFTDSLLEGWGGGEIEQGIDAFS